MLFSVLAELLAMLPHYPGIKQKWNLGSCFATGGPMLWKSLPEQLRQLNITFRQFKRSLKTFLFG